MFTFKMFCRYFPNPNPSRIYFLQTPICNQIKSNTHSIYIRYVGISITLTLLDLFSYKHLKLMVRTFQKFQNIQNIQKFQNFQNFSKLLRETKNRNGFDHFFP